MIQASEGRPVGRPALTYIVADDEDDAEDENFEKDEENDDAAEDEEAGGVFRVIALHCCSWIQMCCLWQ